MVIGERMYKVFNVSIRGASHIRKNTPCEDFGASEITENCKIFAVADGHGATECFRSAIGSEYVCKAAMNALHTFALNIEENAWEDELLHYPKKQEVYIRQLISNIFSTWINSVNTQWEENPITEDEKLLAGKYLDGYMQGEKVEHIYGTTLIAGLMTDRYLLLLQQGDGHCDVFDINGNVSQPIPWDERCFANVTTSVCDTDAVESCRYCLIDLQETPIMACIAGSDGVEDSYASMDKMHSFYRNLLLYASENGTIALQEYLQEVLPQLSENGSNDDITICGIINELRAEEVREDLKRANEITNLQDIIRRADEKMNSMSRKLAGLAERYKSAETEYLAYKEQYEQRQREKEEAEKKLAELISNNMDEE